MITPNPGIGFKTNTLHLRPSSSSPSPEVAPPAPEDQAQLSPGPTPPPDAKFIEQTLRALTERALQAGLGGQLLGALSAGLAAEAPPARGFQQLDSKGLTLDHVGGLYEPIEEMRELVNSLTQTQPTFQIADGSPAPQLPVRHGFLLDAWDGGGKTHLLRAVTGELSGHGIPVLEAPAADFTLSEPADGNGTGPDRLARLFDQAREEARNNPHRAAVIAIEDLDALAPVRGDSTHAGNQMVTRFCHEMERVEADGDLNLVVIATTSREDVIDVSASNALQHVRLLNPRNSGERQDILRKMVARQNFQLESADSAIKNLADSCSGKTIGQLCSILEGARERAAERGSETISSLDVKESKLELFYGPVKEKIDTPEWFFRLSVAHEVGHSVIRHLMEEIAEEDGQEWAKPQAIDELVMQPRGDSMASVSLKYSGNPSKTFEYFFAEIASNYGGRAAEHLLGDGHLSAGPQNDLSFATGLANEAVDQLGMGVKTGVVRASKTAVTAQFSADTADDIRLLTETAEKASMSIVTFYKDLVSDMADEYVEKRRLAPSEGLTESGEQFKARVQAWEAGQSPESLIALKAKVRTLRDMVKPKQPEG